MASDQMKRHRHFRGTQNNYEDTALLDQLPGVKYVVYGKEVAPSTGTPHLQWHIWFKSAKTHSAVVKLLPGCHVLTADFPSESIEYCKKDGNFTERGTPPVTKQAQGELEKARYKRAWEAAKAGDLDDIDPDIRIRHYNTLKRIKEDYQEAPASMETFDFHWYQGPSGTGKSRTAHEENPGAYLKNPNKWWDGYTPGQTVIIDEWSPGHACLADHLKKWADHHPFCAETKGGTRFLRPPKIIITSNYTISECFPESKDADPLSRRLKVKQFGSAGFFSQAPDLGKSSTKFSQF